MRRNFSLSLALIHLALFFGTLFFTRNSSIEQTSLVWLFWFPVDLPWSLFYFIGGENYSAWVEHISENSLVLGYILYTPYLIHGIVGTIWWYFLPGLLGRLFGKINKQA